MRITIVNYEALVDAYGDEFVNEVALEVRRRIGDLDIEGLTQVYVDHDREFIRLRGDFESDATTNILDLAEAALAVSSGRPICVDGGSAVLSVCVGSEQADATTKHLLVDGSVVPSSNGATSFCARSYRADMESAVAVHEAMSERRMRLAFQPVVQRSNQSRILYHESLARLVERDDPMASISAANFVPSLERLGLTRQFDRFMMHECIALLQSDPDRRLGCNISALSARNDVWWSSTLAELARRPDVASRLVIEFTETAECGDTGQAISLLQTFQQLGCLVAIDDFGVGFSSIRFALLARPDIIKIDASFVRQRGSAEADRNLLRHLVGLSSSLASHVVVEGIEDDDDLDLADIIDAPWIQGYRVGRPVMNRGGRPISSADFEALVSGLSTVDAMKSRAATPAERFNEYLQHARSVVESQSIGLDTRQAEIAIDRYVDSLCESVCPLGTAGATQRRSVISDQHVPDYVLSAVESVARRQGAILRQAWLRKPLPG
ncbi:MAG TPA: EAL domain-containing protein [Luteibacter sp.]|nr:EAL domain-containing protein [Luteibacter sp.]